LSFVSILWQPAFVRIMSDSQGGSPIQVAVVALMLVGGGWYFFRHYNVHGLDGVSVSAKSGVGQDEHFVSYLDGPTSIDANRSTSLTSTSSATAPSSPFSFPSDNTASDFSPPPTSLATPDRSTRYRNIKIASWSLDGFGPTKLSNIVVRRHVASVIRKFDVVALQQVASIERDLIPRLVEMINGGKVGGDAASHYDYVLGESTGPSGRQEQMAFVFDTTQVLVDRRQTYTVDDPANQMTYDPLVASFRSARPSPQVAWTFSLINVRIDLARAATEVALLPGIFESVRRDGRGEDDVLMLGLFQADDAYLLPTMGSSSMRAAVQARSTDVFGRYQTSNLLLDSIPTSEFLGRAGVYDYARAADLNPIEAETVTSHLPVFADFTAHEGGQL
jgi:deoxyribonuclease-1-like protein